MLKPYQTEGVIEAGCDEAGRGCLAGDVYAAAVILDTENTDAELLSKIKGRITPYFSWDNADEFLSKGKGYCIVTDGEVAAWAFSAAVSSTEIDIGIETQEKYQHRGFAAIVSKAMIKYVLEQGKIPVWACHYKNIASAKLADKLGFDKVAECFVIKRKED